MYSSKFVSSAFSLCKRLQQRLEDMDTDAGVISITVFPDCSGHMDLHLWGLNLSSAELGKPFYVNEVLVKEQNPDWLPEVRSIVEELNKLIEDDHQ